jgi:hypothetical protein
MNANAIFAFALLFGAVAGASPALAASEFVTPVVLKNPSPVACASGYHLDASANCQPDTPTADIYCPQPGLIYQPEPWGWNCVPAPAGY